MVTRGATYRSLQAGVLAGSLLLASGCKSNPFKAGESQPTPAQPVATTPAPRSDQDVANDIQTRINGQSALNGQNIQVVVNGGMATLNGSVNNDAARALAAAESGGVNGVRTVVNNLTVSPQRAEKAPPAPAPERKRRKTSDSSRQNQQAQNQQDTPDQQPPMNQPPEQVRTVPAAPPPPTTPAARTVSIASGTSLPVRLTDALDSATAQQGQVIHGTLASDIISENMVAIPRGTVVTGRVVDAKDATHFTGNAALSIELTQVELKGRQVPITTTPYSEQGKGRGKNTAMKAGGGAALGAIIGALAGGGKGAAIGAASGGGIGAGVNAVTRGQQVKIPAETLINFKLQSPISVTTSRSANGSTGQAPRDFNDSGYIQPQQQ